MREYILESSQRELGPPRFGNIPVIIDDEPNPSINLQAIFKILTKKIPDAFLRKIEAVHIGELPEFSERDVNALYKDNKLYVSATQEDPKDLIDDVVHEIAHHLETLYTEELYGDTSLLSEFIHKRTQLEFELRSEGYWTNEYDFRDLKYNQHFDKFLYQRVGKNMLKTLTAGLFIRPYASISLREYFATGFEAYYLGQAQELLRISPALYAKISTLINNQ